MQKIEKQKFFEIFPWQKNHLAKGRQINWFWQFTLDVPVSQIWPHLVDTSRLNRFFKLPKMEFTEKEGTLYGKANYFGINLLWKEYPWTWVFEKNAIDIREYDSAILKIFRGIFYFEEGENKNQSNLTIQFGFILGNFLFRFLFSLLEGVFYSVYKKALLRLEKKIIQSKSEKKISILKPPSPILSDEVLSKLKKISSSLLDVGVKKSLVDKLVGYIKTEDEMDLYRIRVLEIADRWGVESKEILRACLYATREGLLTLSWDVICPHCRGVRVEAKTLGDIQRRGSCDVCEIDFDNNAENSIEVTFHVHPSIRKIPKVLYCSAEASLKPHIKLQQILKAGETIFTKTHLESGNYRLRIKGHENHKILSISEQNPVKKILWNSTDLFEEFFSSEDVEFELQNTLAQDLIFTLEETSWNRYILKPSLLFNMQDFHDLFSSEYISSDLQLEIGEQTILFTDMVGSTKFYANEGDSKAFLEVKKHFEEIFQKVGFHNGAVIKTIGDAVMASFAESSDAIKASVALQRLFYQTRKDTPIRLRVSIHSGKCIAVNLNSNIDYFGGTVNLAAKIQNYAGSGQIAFTEDFFLKHGVRDYLQDNSIGFDLKDAEIPGLNKKVKIYIVQIE